MSQLGIEIILMRQLASDLAVPILIVDRERDLLFFNESAEPILGRRFEETGTIQRGEWTGVFRPSGLDGSGIPPEEQPLTRATDHGEPSHRRFSLTGLDGVARIIEGVALPLATREAGLIGAAGIFWEASEHGAARASLAANGTPVSCSRYAVEVVRLRRLADRLLMPIFVTDAEGRRIFYNPAAAALIGRPFAELGPVPLREWYAAFQPRDEDGAPIDVDDHPLSVARLRQQPSYRRLQYRGLDGVQRCIDATAFPLLGQCDRHLGAVGIFWKSVR
jgi:PAS domain-containing protein